MKLDSLKPSEGSKKNRKELAEVTELGWGKLQVEVIKVLVKDLEIKKELGLKVDRCL